LAKNLVAHDASAHQPAGPNLTTAFQVTEKLRPVLANLMGAGGFQAVMSRALMLAGAEVSWVRALQVKADGTLDGLHALDAKITAAEVLEGSSVVLADLLGLLVAFIGPSLTSRLVSEIWPKFPSATWDSAGEEVVSEKAK
jgi:hypothetical protein